MVGKTTAPIVISVIYSSEHPWYVGFTYLLYSKLCVVSDSRYLHAHCTSNINPGFAVKTGNHPLLFRIRTYIDGCIYPAFGYIHMAYISVYRSFGENLASVYSTFYIPLL